MRRRGLLNDLIDDILNVFANSPVAGAAVILLFAVYFVVYFYFNKQLKQEKITKVKFRIIIYAVLAAVLIISSFIFRSF